MADTLTDKIAIITGAGSGIGKEMALLFHSEGAKVVIVDVVPKRIEETVGLFTEGKDRVHSMVLDLRKPESIKKMVEETVKV